MGGSLDGYAGRWLVGQVITYDGDRWAAHVRHGRIGEPWYPSALEAMAAVDDVWTPTAEMVRARAGGRQGRGVLWEG